MFFPVVLNIWQRDKTLVSIVITVSRDDLLRSLEEKQRCLCLPFAHGVADDHEFEAKTNDVQVSLYSSLSERSEPLKYTLKIYQTAGLLSFFAYSKL